MLKRWSKNGWFLGCENYPKCKHTQNLDKEGKLLPPKAPPVETTIKCEKCGNEMVVKWGRRGEFLAGHGADTPLGQAVQGAQVDRQPCHRGLGEAEPHLQPRARRAEG